MVMRVGSRDEVDERASLRLDGRKVDAVKAVVVYESL